MTFVRNQIGKSLFDEEGSHLVSQLVEKARRNQVLLCFPMDFVIADRFAEDANVDYVDEEGKGGLAGIPEGWMVNILCGWPPTVIEWT